MMEIKKMPRNGLIDIMRLGFAGIVMMYHFYSGGEKHFQGGYLGVDYFMILAGLLFFSAWDHKRISSQSLLERQRYWLGYMKKRYTRFFWYSLTAFVFIFIVVRLWHNQGENLGDALSGDIWEVLLVKMNGLNRGAHMLNEPAWTLSCMLFAEFFILGMLTFMKRPFLMFLMPMSVIFGMGYWSNLQNDSMRLFHTFFTFGMLEVYLLMCFGIFAYWICKKLKTLAFSQIGQAVLAVIELAGFAVCIWIACTKRSIYYRFCFDLIAIFVLAISFSRKSFAGSKLPANAFTNFCAELSLSLYLTHCLVYKIFRFLYEDINEMYRKKFVFLTCALVAALVYTFIMRRVFKILPIAKRKLRSVLLE